MHKSSNKLKFVVHRHHAKILGVFSNAIVDCIAFNRKCVCIKTNNISYVSLGGSIGSQFTSHAFFFSRTLCIFFHLTLNWFLFIDPFMQIYALRLQICIKRRISHLMIIFFSKHVIICAKHETMESILKLPAISFQFGDFICLTNGNEHHTLTAQGFYMFGVLKE